MKSQRQTRRAWLRATRTGQPVVCRLDPLLRLFLHEPGAFHQEGLREQAAAARAGDANQLRGIEDDEKVVAFALVDDEGKFIVTLAREDKSKHRCTYNTDRPLIGVRIDEAMNPTAMVTDGECELLIATAVWPSASTTTFRHGAARGVKGIDLRSDDIVVGMGVYHQGDRRDRVLTCERLGYGKQTIEKFRLQSLVARA